MPERDHSLDGERERWLQEARKEEPDVEAQRQALVFGGSEKQIFVFSAWLETHLRRSRERFGDPFTKPPFTAGKKPKKS